MANDGIQAKDNSKSRQINLWLQTELNNSQTISPADIKHVVTDKSFLAAVDMARESLGLTVYYPKNENEENIDYWMLLQVAGGKESLKASKRKHREIQRFIDDIIFQAISSANLQSGWFTFMGAYIALGKQPKTSKPIYAQRIYAEKVSDDNNSVLIRMDKGLSSDEYKRAWKALKKFLHKPSSSTIHAEVTKNKIYLDRLKGLSYGGIAKKYYPDEYAKDQVNKTDYARDKVKKIVARFKITT